MNRGRTVFAQLLQFITFGHFEHLVDRFAANRGVNEFTTSICSTRFAKSALEVADYAYVMEHGKVAVEGTPAELNQNQRVLAAYLG